MSRGCSSVWAAGLLVAAFGGCAGSDSVNSGSLVIPFEFGKGKDCATTGVEVVRAELNTGETAEGSCRRGRVRFDDLDAGAYTFVLYGIDAQGRSIMDSRDRKPVRVNVLGDNASVLVDPVLLVAAPVQVKLRWTFGFGSCESDEVGSFAITAWQIDGMTQLLSAKLGCLTPGEHLDNYRLVPDPSRLLVGDQVGAVDVQALDPSGLPVGDHVHFTFPAPSAGGEVRLSISCDEGGCTGSGTPDPLPRTPTTISTGTSTISSTNAASSKPDAG